MRDHAFTIYFVAGVLCAIGCRMLLRRLKIEPTRYWSIILGEGSEAIIFTVLLWPVTLAAIVVWYVLKELADRYDAKLRARDSERDRERIKREQANPLSTLSLDELLKKVDEQRKETSRQ